MTTCKPRTLRLMVEHERLRVEGRLQNWLRWCEQDSDDARRGICGSAENRYTAPAADSDRLASQAAYRSVDVTDAERVDMARRLLPLFARDYIALVYCKGRKLAYVQRALGYSAAQQDATHVAVLSELRDQLEKLDRCNGLIRRGKPLWAGLAPR